MFKRLFGSNNDEDINLSQSAIGKIDVKVVGIGGAGGNAIQRMVGGGLEGVHFLGFRSPRQVAAPDPRPPLHASVLKFSLMNLLTYRPLCEARF